MNAWLLFFFVAILIAGGLVLAFIATRSRGGAVLNVEKFRSQWLSIEQQLQHGNEASYHLCTLNADKLLGDALKQRGFKGETMGERMKSANDAWSNANNVWASHKLRNQIAHESNIRVEFDTARRALAGFKQGLKDLGAI